MALAALAVAAGGCGGGEPAPAAPADLMDVQAAYRACLDGDPEAGLASLDVAVDAAPGDPDALVARGLCRWRLSAASGDGAGGAYDDLTDAAEAVQAGAPSQTPLDEIYGHRAYVAQAVDGDWTRALADLDRAVRAAPGRTVHVLDRGVAHALAGDTLAARRDLRRFVAIDTLDESRRRAAEAMLEDLDPTAAPEP